MATIKLEGLNVASSANSVVTLDGSVAIAANHAGVKTALNASGDAPIYACRAWVNFRGTSQSGTATASGLVTGLYTATVVTATQFTVEYSGTTYTINTSGNHEIGDGEGVDLTVSGTTVTIDTQIRGSGNVSSCQDNGSGNYTVNFATVMSDANYSIGGDLRGSAGYGSPMIVTSYTSSSFTVQSKDNAGNLGDRPHCDLQVFR